MQFGRARPYQRNQALEGLLEELNAALEPAERSLLQPGADPRLPLVLVIGPPRSGTTLALQWLAASGCFACPSNLLARFWAAPAIGARIQMLLTDPRYAFRDELFDLAAPTDFTSDLGKTRGALAPNEFWYFWRRFLPSREIRPLSGEEIEGVDAAALRAELAAVEAVLGKPLAMKGLMLQYDLEAFASLLPKAFFLYLRRDLQYNAQSLLEARERFFGDRQRWYSAKPREYEELRGLDPVRQVAGQVHYTRGAIERGLHRLPEHRWLSIDYEDLCRDPGGVWAALRAGLARVGFELDPDDRGHPGPERFESTNRDRLPAGELRAIDDALEELASSAPLPERTVTE